MIIGRHEPAKMMSWSGAIWANFPGFPESLNSEYGIKVYGQGHVVAHNYVANFHDAIDISTYGEPDGTPDIDSTKLSGPTELDERNASSIDFFGNDIYNMGDNCIESDGGAHNLRVFENRCFNSAAASLSAQPIFGGPVYFYRNLVYTHPAAREIRRHAGGGIRLSEHVCGRRHGAGRAGIERPSRQQPVFGAARQPAGLLAGHHHQLFDVGL